MNKKAYVLFNLIIILSFALGVASLVAAAYFHAKGFNEPIYLPLVIATFGFWAIALVFLLVCYPGIVEYRTKKKYAELAKRPLCFAYQSDTAETLARRLGKLGFYPAKNGFLFRKIPYLLTGSINFYIAIADADGNPAYFDKIRDEFARDRLESQNKGYRCLAIIGLKKEIDQEDAINLKNFTDYHLTLESTLPGGSSEAEFWLLYETGKGRYLFKNINKGSRIKATFIGAWMLKRMLFLNNTAVVSKTDDPNDRLLLNPEKKES